MTHTRLILLTMLAMTGFAANSLLCRAALKGTGIDAASFTTIRLMSGALVLWLIVRISRRNVSGEGNWLSAVALVIYAAAFSFAYIQLTAATGALLLFVAVQVTMIGYGAWSGDKLSGMQIIGLLIAIGGLASLLLPGFASPPLASALLMLSSGVAWGVYSLRGRGTGDATRISAGNFMRAAVVSVALSAIVITHGKATLDEAGVLYAVLSGALASGLGYVIWYIVLPELRPTIASTVQLSVPVLAAFGGVMFLGESVTVGLVLASAAILGGIALVILDRRISANIGTSETKN